MVRLVAKMKAGKMGLNMFQFHYGTIGSDYSLNNRLLVGCFNSTMVRLVVTFKSPKNNIFFWFQFHYGTIGRKI